MSDTNESTTSWQQEAANLRHELAELRNRLNALEAKETKPAPPASTAPTGGDYTDAFHHGLQAQLRRERELQNSGFAVAVVAAVSQSAQHGFSGTALSVVTAGSASEMADEEVLTRRRERALLYLQNPLVLPIFNAFYKLLFENERRPTSEQLALLVGATPEQVDEALRPLVQNETVSRGLSASNEPFYEWEGNTTVITALLFHD